MLSFDSAQSWQHLSEREREARGRLGDQERILEATRDSREIQSEMAKFGRSKIADGTARYAEGLHPDRRTLLSLGAGAALAATGLLPAQAQDLSRARFRWFAGGSDVSTRILAACPFHSGRPCGRQSPRESFGRSSTESLKTNSGTCGPCAAALAVGDGIAQRRGARSPHVDPPRQAGRRAIRTPLDLSCRARSSVFR